MALGTTLWLRIMLILLGGLTLLQVLMLAALPLIQREPRPLQLPNPTQLAAMLEILEAAPAENRAVLVSLLNDSLYTVEIRESDILAERSAPASQLEREYQGALPGRDVRITGRRNLVDVGIQSWIGGVISPLVLSVPMADGSVLRIDTRPSPAMAGYLQQRALIGALGGLLLLAAVAFALRLTTRPLRELAQHVRHLPAALDGPDARPAGTDEVRALTAAFNDMKARVGELLAQRTRLLADIAHDLRTYLTRLRLRADFIEDADQRRRAVADLDEMSALLDDTLLVARPSGADGEPAAALAVELPTLVAQRREIGEAVTLAGELPPVRVRISATALKRILNNLVDNGLRYGTHAQLRVAVEEGAAVVIVSDDGPGVPAEALPSLGQPYYRVDPSRDRTTGGAGLGLAIVRSLVERHGGSVDFSNRSQGGFEARLTLPLEPEAT